MTDTPETAPATAVEKNEAEQAAGAQAQATNEVAQETGAAAPQPTAEAAPTEENKATLAEGANFVTFVEDADAAAPETPAPTAEQAQPSTIQLQQPTAEELAAAKVAEEKLAASHAPVGDTIKLAPENTQPALDKTAAEMAVGRQRVAEHEGRLAMQAAKAEDDKPEGERVAAAGVANKDL